MRNVAKTVGTTIGVAGAILAPFTFGLSLAVTAVGATVNITTDIIDKSETEEFEKRIQSHLTSLNRCIEELKSVQEKVKTANENVLKTSDIKDVSQACLVALWSSDSNHARVLLTVLSTPVVKEATRLAIKLAAKNAYVICG